ncbi:KdsC family phosphatase [Lacihabitans soyangensis]|uniref:3-deoxy-D-manno-octulosonate 8-phosphate phosphatase KdsC n=1 Tax=Lacihabitans soyangensis TaxID=869394 RepID=A0AAE3H1J2_9BACT|nr:HAD-IA family hydrolase [Lacihabitans soyangensis]MCP9763083.1 3-deoxy-D-manno-octulosonate 8-phosphate phosphatase [Lacihabitans soyangensis]
MDIKLKSKLSKITTFVFDVDGVFTDATLLVGESDVQRVFNVRDGYAVQIAVKSGYRMAVISGGKQKSIATRLSGLGIQDVYLSVGTDQKLSVFQEYIAKNNLQEEEVLFIGDDIPDYLLMKNTKVLACCPADATEEVKGICDFITPNIGGKGAVRDVIELVMKAQNKWMKVF